MLLDEVIEQRCPDFVVPWQRAEDADTSMAESKPGAELCKMLQYIRNAHKTREYIKVQSRFATISCVTTRVENLLGSASPETKKTHVKEPCNRPSYPP